MNYAVSISHEPQMTYVMTSDRNICYEHALSIQRDCFWRACVVRWPTTVTSKPNAHSKFKSLTCSKFKSLTANSNRRILQRFTSFVRYYRRFQINNFQQRLILY